MTASDPSGSSGVKEKKVLKIKSLQKIVRRFRAVRIHSQFGISDNTVKCRELPESKIDYTLK